jgi:hypothetical protein
VQAERFLKNCEQATGYLTVSLGGKTHRVHRLVMMGYEPIDNPEDYQVNHIDGDKTNNCLDNLEWCTAKENSIHAVRTGLNPKRFNDEPLIHKICSLVEDGWRNKDIAESLNIPHGLVANIKCGYSHTYISQEYNFSVRRNEKLSVEKVYKICKLLSDGGLMGVEIAKLVGCNVQAVRNIKARKIHNKISKNFEW